MAENPLDRPDPLAETRALLEAATCGVAPWWQAQPGVVATLEGVWQRHNARHSSAASEEADAALIAAAPRLLAALADEVERSRRVIAASRPNRPRRPTWTTKPS